MNRYILSLSVKGTQRASGPRVLMRASDAEAIDAAIRWLRLHRNTFRHMRHVFDQWTVAAQPDNALPRIIATGDPTSTLATVMEHWGQD